MKLLLTLLLFIHTLSLFCQYSLPIIERDGKYGYGLHSYRETSKDLLIPTIYDTIYDAGCYGSGCFLVAIKNLDADLFYVEEGTVSEVDTLNIRHLYFTSRHLDMGGPVATSNTGKLYGYTYSGQFEPLDSDETIIVRKSDNKYWLMKKGETVSEIGYDYIDNYSGYFVCKKDGQFTFLNENGELLYPQPVNYYPSSKDYFNSSWDVYGYTFVFSDDKIGYFKDDGSEIFPLTSYVNANRVWETQDYAAGIWKWHINDYYAITNGKKFGLLDKEANEIWPVKYKSVVVGYNGNNNFLLRKVKNRSWELYDNDLNLVTVSDFDEFIGYDMETAIVRYGDRLVTYDPGTGDTSHVHYTRQYEDYRVLISPGNKAGVISSDGELIMPCIYVDIRDHHENIIEVKTDSGYVAIDMEGNVSPTAFDRCWEFTESKGVYAYKLGNLWGTFDMNNGSILQPTALYNPFAQFNIDAAAHTSVPEFYLVIEKGKIGVSDKFGEMLHDTEYDEIIKSGSYEAENLFLGMKDGNFYVFKADMSAVKEVKADYFLEFSEKFGFVFAAENELLCIDPVTLEPVAYQSEREGINEIKAYERIHGDFIMGLVDNEGKIVIPFRVQHVFSRNYDSDPYIIVTRDSKDNFYSLEGENVLGESFDNIGVVCSKLPSVLFFEKERNKGGFIAQWNAKEGSLEILVEGVKTVQCVSRKTLDYIADIEFMDGSKGFLYEDLRIEVEE